MKKTMIFSKAATVLTAMALASGVCAIDLPSPNADGKIVLSEESGAYTAKNNVTCQQVVFSANNISLDLSADDGKTITVPSSVTMEDGLSFAGRFSASVIGGFWDFGSKAGMKIGTGSNHQTSIAFRGTKVSNVGDIYIGDNRRICSLTLTEAAELNASSLRIASGSNSDNCKFEILSGSKASIASEYFFSEDGKAIGAGNNILKVDGEGSSLSVLNADITFGRGCSNDKMIISNKGSVSLKNLAVGGKNKDANACATNTLLSVDNASLTVLGTLSIGNDGSFGNKAEFVDAAVSANYLRVGLGENSTNNILVLAGKTVWRQSNPHTVDAYFPFFLGESGNNEVVLTDGFQYTLSHSITYPMYSSGKNTVRIGNGAKVTQDSGVWSFGTVDSKCHHNTYSVESDGSTEIYRAYLAGNGNKFIISNGVFSVTRNNLDAFVVGSDATDSSSNPTIGCELVLRGTKPQFNNKGEMGELKICGGGKGILRFELPAAALETVPVVSGKITVQVGAAIHVKCDDYLSWLGTDSSKVVLGRASTSDRLSISQSVLNAANSELPERCKLLIDGTDLVLKVNAKKGTVVSIR